MQREQESLQLLQLTAGGVRDENTRMAPNRLWSLPRKSGTVTGVPLLASVAYETKLKTQTDRSSFTRMLSAICIV